MKFFRSVTALPLVVLISSMANASGELPAAKGAAPGEGLQPRPLNMIPEGVFGDKVRRGYQLFVNSQQMRGQYVGNELNCVNCHMDAGRQANAAPLWAAYYAYPAFRKKNNKINSYEERLQGCFRYSMNGTPPPAGSPELVAMAAYSYWLGMSAMLPKGEAVPELSDAALLAGGQAQTTPLPPGYSRKDLKQLPGRGYPKLAKRETDRSAGEALYGEHCASCHGDDGQGRKMADVTVFPPLWGPQSFNWGAGMHRVNTAAQFIHANMPLGKSIQLTEQQAWDIAAFVNSHERPQDPRFDGNLQQTREQFHQHNGLYGQELDGKPALGTQAYPNKPGIE